MQIVYISIRPEILKGTLPYVMAYLPFIDEIIVVSPKHMFPDFRFSNDSISLISEEEILGNDAERFRGSDHQSKNYLLRSKLVAHSAIGDDFIMSDDDARPLRPITIENYLNKGRYRAYYYYDLSAWRYGSSSFDVGQRNTYQVLKYYGLPCLSFASHMPQVINRQLYLESVDRFESISRRYALCEWSTYFNYAMSNYPDLFHDPQPYATLCWPDGGRCWPKFVDPQAYLYENLIPDSYEKGGPFEGIPILFSPSEQGVWSITKAIRWYRYVLDAQQLTRDGHAPSWHRAIMLSCLRWLRRVRQIVTWDDRSEIMALRAELADTKRQLRNFGQNSDK